MQHDEHFLSRLARLEREHAEIALGLYYDSTLVMAILHMADIPSDSERVALCLGTPEQGPHIIVARDGHFVTCLGEGMQLREDQPVISRHRLDTISESITALRSLVADARAGDRRQTQRKLGRVFEAGSGLSHEEFEDIARWLPLMAIDFVKAHMTVVDGAHQLVEHLSRHRRLKRHDDEALYEYWRSTWAIAHLTMLLGSDGGETLRRFFDVFEPDMPGAAMQLPWSLIRLGVTSFALRGIWVASKLPAYVVPFAKRRYFDPQASYLSTLTDSSSLAAVGLRHRKYQAEVRKVLEKGNPPDDAKLDRHDIIRHFGAVYFEQHSKDPQVYLNHIIDLSRTFMRTLYKGFPEEQIAGLDRLPSDIPVALFSSIPLGLHDELNAPRSLFEWLPWIVGAEASAFYLPEPFIGILRAPWTRADGMALLDARQQGGVPRQMPVVAEPKIGRNQPCPCGSGKKYKRCCGGPGKA